jgi:hypothetical protein
MIMKTATIRKPNTNSLPRIPYPNAATGKELFHKFLDLLLVGAMGAGAAAMLLLVLVLY